MVQNAKITGFAEKTPILMADGTWKNIEFIAEGDMVFSFNPSIPNAELEPRKVTRTFNSVERECLEVLFNNRITVTAKDQLFFTAKAEFKPCYEIKRVMSYDGVEAPLQNRKVRGGKWKIFDIEVEDNHSLIANGMRVHNKGGSSKKKKVVAQPVVVSGKVGAPLTVSTTTKAGTTTVTVYPPPEEAATIVSNSGAVSLNSQSVPGVPIAYNPVDPIVFLPYPTTNYIHDRVVNTELIRSSVCGDMLSRSTIKKKDVKGQPISNSERTTWLAQLSTMEAELRNMYAVPMPARYPGRPLYYVADPTIVQAALNEVAALKRSVQSSKKVDYFFTEARCANLQSMLARIDASVRFPAIGVCVPIWDPARGIMLYPPCQPHPLPPITVCPPVYPPLPGNYIDAKIYQNDANYNYFTWVETTCRYEFRPPTAGIVSQTYYKHYDSTRGMYYYDRTKDGQICPAGVEAPPVAA